MLKFITGNKVKFGEVAHGLAPFKIEMADVELAEIQGLDPKEILQHKLNEAFRHHKGQFIIDDSSVFFGCFDYKLPGPLIKWFNATIGMNGIYNMCKKMGNFSAKAITYIAYAKSPKQILIFEGKLEGTITKPKGNYGFGYDQIFIPKGQKKTMAEMKATGDFSLSPRGIAVKKLKKYLLGNGHAKSKTSRAG